MAPHHASYNRLTKSLSCLLSFSLFTSLSEPAGDWLAGMGDGALAAGPLLPLVYPPSANSTSAG